MITAAPASPVTAVIAGLAMAVAGCQRPLAPPGVTDGAPVDDLARALDLAGAPDLTAPPADAAVPGCLVTPAPTLIVDGAPIQVARVDTFLAYVGACCPPGPVLRFAGTSAAGDPVAVSLEMTRFPNTPPATMIDFASIPAGWVFAVRCEPYQLCGFQRPDNATLTGQLLLEPLASPPRTRVTLCLDVQPGPNPARDQRPVRMSVDQVVVNEACVPGMDQTCNLDPALSSLHGSCNPDGTCSCNGGATPEPDSGRCL